MFKFINRIYYYVISFFFSKVIRSKNKVTILGKIYFSANNVQFGNNVILYPGVQIWGNGKIIIGDNVAIGKDTIIHAIKEIKIGNNTLIAAQSYIIDNDHGIARDMLIRSQELISKPIFIGNDVWIGAGVKVLKGSHINNGAVIGASSLVRGTIEPNTVNVGIPTKKVGERS